MNTFGKLAGQKESAFDIVAKVIKYLLLLLVVIISLGPILWVVESSFKSYTEIFGENALALPSRFNFDSYIDAFKISPIARYYSNSLIVCSVSTILNIIFVSAGAYVVSRFSFKAKGIVIVLVSASLLLPMQSISQPIFMLFNFLHLSDTKTGLILVYTALGLPVTFYVMRSFFLSIPKEIEESAYIDGAGFLKTFAGIMVPLARPGMATAAIIQFLFNWKEFYFALILTSGDRSRTVPLALNYFKSQFASNFSALYAAIVLTTIPSVIVYLIIQEQVVSNLTAGAMKG